VIASRETEVVALATEGRETDASSMLEIITWISKKIAAHFVDVRLFATISGIN